MYRSRTASPIRSATTGYLTTALIALVLAGFRPARASQMGPAWVSGFWDGTWVTPAFQNFTNPSYPQAPDLSLLFRRTFYTE